MSKFEFINSLSKLDFFITKEGISFIDTFSPESLRKFLFYFQNLKKFSPLSKKIFTSDDLKRIFQEQFLEERTDQEFTTTLSKQERAVSYLGDPFSETVSEAIPSFRTLLFERYSFYFKFFKQNLGLEIEFKEILNLNQTENKVYLVVRVLECEKKTINNKTYLKLALEDMSGMITAYFFLSGLDKEPKIMKDEIICVVGNVEQGKLKKLYIKQLFFPGDFLKKEEFKDYKDFKIGIISDTHFGSKNFLQEGWNKFCSWIKENYLSLKIKYLIICGDLVEGVGMYPNQKQGLGLKDLVKQYFFFSEELKKIPKDIQKIFIPGNHDAVRLVEPQPIIQSSFRKYFASDSIFFNNPAIIDIEGYKIGVYHGKAFDEIVEYFPDFSRKKPVEMMKFMLEKLHFCPFLGGRNHTFPSKKDPLIIRIVPDFLITGHVHTFGYEKYKGVHLVNASTWQGQTPYQKRFNFEPICSVFTLVDLKNNQVEIKFF